ncbi:dihydropteroate synthase [Chloropicon primus]|uniref:Dihydropteroate synthase n=2 Tax=Chloropicon primus TaxID=1764295 RepID=A0A5B8MST4_9CHLO|nr:dihydropteroate synthase [Chloropicon primus]|eukprot:QDZ22685.1 dihydropteroate synthase [Chloropicon primus]
MMALRRLAEGSSSCVLLRIRGLTRKTYATEAVVAVGSNKGDRVGNIWRGLRALSMNDGVEVLQYGSLYETAPAYYEDQDDFLNSSVLLRTELEPVALLDALKGIEKESGRDLVGGIRYGPRTLDLDIVFYGGGEVDHERLRVPHPRWKERSFVLAPLADLEPGSAPSSESCGSRLVEARRAWEDLGGEALVGGGEIRRVTPMGKRVVNFSGRSHIMGILNATPDSFSDGGLYEAREKSVEQVRRMVSLGADIVDIGGQSTRPGADRVSSEEELGRILPVIEAVRRDEELSDVLVSVDTFYPRVAEEAVGAGADIVNDVTAGGFDESMYDAVGKLGTPYVMMHMRGDPKTMQSEEKTAYGDLILEVAGELSAKVHAATRGGIMPWCIITDPGIGFAKTHSQNCEILGRTSELRRALSPGFARNAPMLVGPSRKGFLGTIVGKKDPRERDVATAAALVVASLGECNIFRVHNVAVAADALRVADALRAAGPL